MSETGRTTNSEPASSNGPNVPMALATEGEQRTISIPSVERVISKTEVMAESSPKQVKVIKKGTIALELFTVVTTVELPYGRNFPRSVGSFGSPLEDDDAAPVQLVLFNKIFAHAL